MVKAAIRADGIFLLVRVESSFRLPSLKSFASYQNLAFGSAIGAHANETENVSVKFPFAMTVETNYDFRRFAES